MDFLFAIHANDAASKSILTIYSDRIIYLIIIQLINFNII